MSLEPQNVIVQRFRSKAFSPACLFRFSESSAPLPNYDTVSKGRGEAFLLVGRGEGYLSIAIN
jgi:hypothetical protein